MENISNHIPNDLIISILSKLPLKSLKRFECVHKSWFLLLEDPNFLSIYRKNFISRTPFDSDDRSYILRSRSYIEPYKVRSSFYFISGERLENKVKLNYSVPLEDLGEDFDVVGSCSINGILGICRIGGGTTNFVLWNPAIDDFKFLPPSPAESIPYRKCIWIIHGFGYDLVRNDYKVIRLATFNMLQSLDYEFLGLDEENVPKKDVSYEPVWEIYSLRSDTWRELNIKFPTQPLYDNKIDRCYTEGMCHWWFKSTKYIYEGCLMSFDLSNEITFPTPMPLDMNDNIDRNWVQKHVMVIISGSIALTSYYEETNTIHISILCEIGVKESWIKLFIVGPLNCVSYPIVIGKKGDLFFANNDGKFACLDLDTGIIDELGGEAYRNHIITYYESRCLIRKLYD